MSHNDDAHITDGSLTAVLTTDETRPVALAALFLASVAVGWAGALVVTGESLAEQTWLVGVLGPFAVTILALTDDLEEDPN